MNIIDKTTRPVNTINASSIPIGTYFYGIVESCRNTLGHCLFLRTFGEITLVRDPAYVWKATDDYCSYAISEYRPVRATITVNKYL